MTRVQALYDAVNDLPSDDPLRTPPQKTIGIAPKPAHSAANATPPAQSAAPSPTSAAQSHAATQQTSATQNATQTVTVSDGARLRVPSLLGLPVRQVIEQAAAAGLEVQIVGNGTARQQAPDPGTMVAPGTKIVVALQKQSAPDRPSHHTDLIPTEIVRILATLVVDGPAVVISGQSYRRTPLPTPQQTTMNSDMNWKELTDEIDGR